MIVVRDFGVSHLLLAGNMMLPAFYLTKLPMSSTVLVCANPEGASMDDNWENQDATWDTWGDAPKVQPEKPKDKKKEEEEDENLRPIRPEEGTV